jgi:hypothetical protein
LLLLFFVVLSPRPAKKARPIWTIYTLNDAVSRKEVPFWGPVASKNFQGVHFSKKSQNWAGIEISRFNKSMNNFSTVHTIFVQIAQSPQLGEKKNQKFQRNHQNFVLWVSLFEKTPPMGISSQNTLLNNFSPVQPILITSNTPI